VSIESPYSANVSIFSKNIDITEIRVDDNDMFGKPVDFFTLFRHICHKMAFNST